MIEYKTGIEVIDWDGLYELYRQVDGVIGLARKGDFDKIKRSFLVTYKIVTAWDGDKIIGAGRMISDGECYGWIHDVGVLPERQGHGIGKKIILELMNEEENLLYGLTSAFGAEDFYHNLGFRKHKTAMAKYPGKSKYLEG